MGAVNWQSFLRSVMSSRLQFWGYLFWSFTRRSFFFLRLCWRHTGMSFGLFFSPLDHTLPQLSWQQPWPQTHQSSIARTTAPVLFQAWLLEEMPRFPVGLRWHNDDWVYKLLWPSPFKQRDSILCLHSLSSQLVFEADIPESAPNPGDRNRNNLYST